MIAPPFYVIADTHWLHENIVRFCGRDRQIEWLVDTQIDAMLGINRLQRAGDRAPVVDHNEYMVERWNAVVGDADTVLHLGDLHHWRDPGPAIFAADIAPRLKGRRKFLIMGNHDKGKPGWYRSIGFEPVEPFITTINGRRVSFGHYPRPHAEFDEHVIHVHGHIHNNGYPRIDGPGGWGAGTEPTMPGQINVSVEVIDYTPRSVEELIPSRGVYG